MQYTYEQASSMIKEMESHYDSGFSSLERQSLNDLYKQIRGKGIANRSCSNCYKDAFIIISLYLKKNTEMPNYEYQLMYGIVIHSFGSPDYYANNIPTDIAENWLKQDKTRIKHFLRYPKDWENRLNASEIAPEATNDAVQTTTPTTKKRGGRKKKTL